jgi:hypothetical protein
MVAERGVCENESCLTGIVCTSQTSLSEGGLVVEVYDESPVWVIVSVAKVYRETHLRPQKIVSQTRLSRPQSGRRVVNDTMSPLFG